MMGQKKIRMGVDIGGTFTDIVLDIDGALFSTKLLTTYQKPEEAIVNGMRQLCKKAAVNVADIGQVIHGTTLATNALIERNGAKTALITTKGFRDVIEMRTESRFEQYDLNLKLPEPLLPRQCRFTLNERIGADGKVYIALQRSDVEALVTQLIADQYTSIAVGLLHSYVDDSHEKLVQTVLTEMAPHIMVSLSSEVSPQMREYERFNTVVANAYIKPLMKSYLDRLGECLCNEGITVPIFLMHSGGGIISLQNAAEFPVRLVESGPAGGAIFAATIASHYGLDKVLSFDMGGTTAKICLINQQTPKTSRVFEVARTYRFKKGSGMPISIPVIDMVEIGAGGGSLARVDSMQQIRVGPESAGSEPGPACYDRGGLQPAVTDADLVLGKLDADNFAGGSIRLNKARSQQSLRNALGDKLGMDAQTAAYGLVEVVDENMSNAARVHAVENGEDLADYTMIAFGGAAPLHATRLCEKLNIGRLLVPMGAGVGSAIGFLRAPFSFEANKSLYMRIAHFNKNTVQTVLHDLQTEAIGFVLSCDIQAEIKSEFKVYMRYIGQGWEIPIVLTSEQAKNPDAAVFRRLFEADYSRLFGRAVEGMDIEITVWAVNATTIVDDITAVIPITKTGEAKPDNTRMVFDTRLGHATESTVFTRNSIAAGETIKGPAVIVEDETTIIMPTSTVAIKQSDGCIDITI